MRSVHGTFATLLLMVPVLAIPALAIFGIPQFAPVVASPLDEGATTPDRERRVGKSARPSGDHLEELEDAPFFGTEAGEPGSALPPGKLGDAVPLRRPGRFSRDDRSAELDPRSRLDAPSSMSDWADDLKQDPHLGASENSNRRAQDFPRVDSRSRTIPSEHQAQPPTTPGDSFGGHQPNAYQRRRETPQTESTGRIPGDTEPLTWQTAVRRLNELEIRNFRLQPGHRENQFLFICSYTPSDSPRLSYRYEAEADEPLKAVEKVLEQIVESQQRR